MTNSTKTPCRAKELKVGRFVVKIDVMVVFASLAAVFRMGHLRSDGR